MQAVMKIEVDGVEYVEVLPTLVPRVRQAGVPNSARAGRRQIEVEAYHAPTPLDLCLDTWVRWQQRDDSKLGWRSRSVMLQGDDEADSEQLYSHMDDMVAQAVEAMMRGLPRHLDWAIRRRCGIATVWRFPSLVFADVLLEAEQALEQKLKMNVATRVFFT